MKLKYIILTLFALWMTSCSTPKDVTYLQNIDQLTPSQIEGMRQKYISQICIDDLLNITVTSSDPTVATPFNPPASAYPSQGEEAISASQSMYNYLVDTDGEINFPVLGRIHVAGMNVKQLSMDLETRLKQYIKDPLVNITITNFKVTVVGDVNHPNIFTVKNSRCNILQALGYVGDLRITANRKNVLLIRDNNGKREIARLDLTDPMLINSPYFYLMQNDFIYIEPNDAMQRNSKLSSANQYTITLFSSILSAISVITTVILAISK